MRRSTVLATAAAAALAAALAPAAHANHVNPSVTASLAMGKGVRDCDGNGFCGGSRRATVSWSSSCGPGVPQSAIDEIEVNIVGITPTGRRYFYDGTSLDSSAGFNGSVGMTVSPGVRFEAEVIVSCSVMDDLGDVHGGSADATTGQAFVRPRLAGYSFGQATWCGARASRKLHTGQYYEMGWNLRFDEAALLRPGRSARRQIKLFARGAGVRLRRAPDRSLAREYGGMIGTWFTPRRAGTLKIWATIGGHRTNTIRVKVLRKRC